MNETTFNKLYWASMPPELQAMDPNITPDQDIRSDRCIKLAMKGFKIDVPIMIWGWDPYKVMKMRLDYGYTWVPSALQPNLSQMGTAAPGLSGPGLTPYDPSNPPGGAIKVSLDPKDYPPYPKPPVPKPAGGASGVEVTAGDPVGVQSVGTLYYSVPGDPFMDGDKFTDARGTFLKHITITPFGRSPYWEMLRPDPPSDLAGAGA